MIAPAVRAEARGVTNIKEECCSSFYSNSGFSVERLRREIAKVLNSTEDAHTKSLSTFEMDEHLRGCRAVYDLPTRPTFLISDDPYGWLAEHPQ